MHVSRHPSRARARGVSRGTASVALAALAATVLVAGCGEGDEEEGKQVGTLASVACPSQASGVKLPAGWAVPLPDGTVPVDVSSASNGRTIVTGVVPMSESEVLKAMQRNFADAGLKLTEGETEEHDAESNFTGNGLTGRWGIREMDGCGSPATRVDVVVRKS